MPTRLPLQAVPNQSFTVQLDGISYLISLKVAGNVMVGSVTIDEVATVSSARVQADLPLITYEFQEGDGGNFIFTTELDAIPFYTEFEITQFLYHLTPAEVADAR